MSESKSGAVTFRVHNGWAMVSELFGDKVRVRATTVGKTYRVSDEHNQHRCNEFECEGTVRFQPKRVDISNFTATTPIIPISVIPPVI